MKKLFYIFLILCVALSCLGMRPSKKKRIIALQNASYSATYRSFESVENSGSVSTVTKANISGLIDGDMIITFITADLYSATMDTPPSGHIQADFADEGAELRTWVYYKEASSEPATWQWDFLSTGNVVVHTIAISKSGGSWVVPTTAGYHSNSVDAAGTNAALQTGSVTGIASSVLLCGWGHDGGGGKETTPDGAPSGMAVTDLRVKDTVSQTAYYQQVNAGAVQKTFTWDANDELTSCAVIVGVN